MFNKQVIIIAALSLFPILGFAAQEASDRVRYSTDVPQTLSINSPEDPAIARTGEAMGVTWTISSNNAFRYTFSGTSKDDNGTTINIPRLHKQDVDASGNLIPNRYDNLDTTAGVVISNYDSVQKSDNWGMGEDAIGSLEELVRSEADNNSPYGTTGRIMPGDDSSEANISLYLRGEADESDQSGLYTTEVMITVIADEQEVMPPMVNL